MAVFAQAPDRHPDAALRATVDAGTGVVVSTHHLANAAGARILAAGGNAVDAAIAVNAVLGVVRPETCGLGGDLFALVHRPDDAAPAAVNASGRAGSGADASMLRAQGLTSVPLRSPVTVTVPGCVDGWGSLIDRFGSMTLDRVLAPAIELAAEGFEVSGELADSLAAINGLIGDQPSAATLYPDGSPPAPGSSIRRPELANTLDSIATGGRDAFYSGEPGEAIVAATDGVIRMEDLAVGQADWVEPLGLGLHGLDAWTIPPNSQGYLTLAATWIAERLDADRGSALRHHQLIEAYRSVAWERDRLVADPATAPLDPDRLADPRRLGARLATIDADTVTMWPRPRPAPGGTAFMCVIDSDAMGVSLIQSNFHGIGSGLSAGATGVFLHNRGAGFSLEPGHPNELTPGRRPLHTLSPTLWTERGRLRLLLGTRGGEYQPQLLVQVVDHLLGAGLPLADAVAQPRWVLDRFGPGTGSDLLVESRMSPNAVEGLRARGHVVTLAGPWERGWGPVAVIAAGATTIEASGDPRVSTSGATTVP